MLLGITNGPLAALVLDRLATSEELAVLHRATDVVEGRVVSDIDLVVRRHPALIVLDAWEMFAEFGLWPIMAWRYDSGDTLTVFLSSANATDGLQFDFLRDPEGIGKYGLRTDQLLEAADRPGRWPTLDPVDEVVYLIRKRYVKGQGDRVSELVEMSARIDPARIASSVDRMLRPDSAASVRALLSGEEPSRQVSVRRLKGEVARRYDRSRHPTGAWIHCREGAVADAASYRFGQFLPHTDRIDREVDLRSAVRIAATRWRAGLVLTSGPDARHLRPDLTIEHSDPEVGIASITGHLSERCLRLLRGLLPAER